MFRDLFSGLAAEYASCRPSYPAALVDWLADAAPGRERAWDAGCGSGQLTVPLAARFAEVIATDASAAQLEHARPHPRVRYRHAPSEESGLADASVDLAVAAQAAHWFDLPRYREELGRVSRPRAIVALITYGLPAVAPSIDERVLRFYHDDLGEHWPPERRLVEDGYRSIDLPFDELDAPAFAMTERWTVERFLGYVGTWSALRAMMAGGSSARRESTAFVDDLHRLWGPEPRAVTWPLSLRVARGPDENGR